MVIMGTPFGMLRHGFNFQLEFILIDRMFPTIAVFYPDFARSMLEYRVSRISGAQLKVFKLKVENRHNLILHPTRERCFHGNLRTQVRKYVLNPLLQDN